MRFFANLEPIIKAARSRGNRVFLLAHSMGNWALQSALESHGNGDAHLFDEAMLAAADEVYDSFKTIVASLSPDEQGALFCGTAQRVYRVPSAPR